MPITNRFDSRDKFVYCLTEAFHFRKLLVNLWECRPCHNMDSLLYFCYRFMSLIESQQKLGIDSAPPLSSVKSSSEDLFFSVLTFKRDIFIHQRKIFICLEIVTVLRTG